RIGAGPAGSDARAGRRRPRRQRVRELPPGVAAALGAGAHRRVAARLRARDQRLRDAVVAGRRTRTGARERDLQRRRHARLARRGRRLVRAPRLRTRRDRPLQLPAPRTDRHGARHLGGTALKVRLPPGRALLYGFLLLGVLFALLPIAIVVVDSFNSSSFGQWPPPGFSTRWYSNLFDNGGFGGPAVRSVELAVAATAASLAVGTLAALALARYRLHVRRPLQGFLAAPLIVPKVAIGFAAFILFLKLGWY